MADGSNGTPASAPTGQGDYVVQSGDCISSIALEHGHFWKTLWDDEGNRELRETRQQPNVLMPGDRVTIPPIRPREETRPTEQRHRFVRKGEPSHLELCILDQDKPRANEPYELDVDGRIFKGTTDGDGKLKVGIPGNSRKGHLKVGTGNDVLEYDLNLGGLDPVDALTGLQSRLKNMGYDCDATGELDEKTRRAIAAFRSDHSVAGTDVDDALRAAVKQEHGS